MNICSQQHNQFVKIRCENMQTDKIAMTKSSNGQWKCDICEGTFSQRSNLKHHIKVKHYGIKEFKCDICGREFPKKQYLQYHTRVHTGEKPYKCKLCHKTCSRKDHLKRHEKLAHVFVCDFSECDLKFINNAKLQNHISTCHSECENNSLDEMDDDDSCNKSIQFTQIVFDRSLVDENTKPQSSTNKPKAKKLKEEVKSSFKIIVDENVKPTIHHSSTSSASTPLSSCPSSPYSDLPSSPYSDLPSSPTKEAAYQLLTLHNDRSNTLQPNIYAPTTKLELEDSNSLFQMLDESNPFLHQTSDDVSESFHDPYAPIMDICENGTLGCNCHNAQHSAQFEMDAPCDKIRNLEAMQIVDPFSSSMNYDGLYMRDVPFNDIDQINVHENDFLVGPFDEQMINDVKIC